MERKGDTQKKKVSQSILGQAMTQSSGIQQEALKDDSDN